MPDVFISYSTKDEELAQFVRQHLEAQKLSVFIASLSLVAGERWTPKIISELKGSQWVVLLATKDALASASVQMEAGAAIFGEKKVVPIMWNVKPEEVPRWISDYQGILLSDSTMEHLATQVSQLAAKIKANKDTGLLVVLAILAGLFIAGRQ
ncbi:MAG: toll/interleukin-1 receptor domain-containing protein [Pseudomonadota bacterium]